MQHCVEVVRQVVQRYEQSVLTPAVSMLQHCNKPLMKTVHGDRVCQVAVSVLMPAYTC